MQLFLSCMSGIALVESNCASRLCLYRASLLDPLGPVTRADAWNGKELSHTPMLRPTILHQGKNFQIESIIGVIGDDVLLDNRSRWIHEVTVETILTWHKNEQRYLRYWIDLDDSQVPLGH
jgi:hypothetical protein